MARDSVKKTATVIERNLKNSLQFALKKVNAGAPA